MTRARKAVESGAFKDMIRQGEDGAHSLLLIRLLGDPLCLVKSADRGVAQVGDVVTFTLRYSNRGGQPMTPEAIERRLRQHGIPGLRGRTAALRQPSTAAVARTSTGRSSAR